MTLCSICCDRDITFREYTRRVPGGAKHFLILFSAISFAFLAVLLAAMSFLG